MNRKCIGEFLQDESGGYTILGLFWFILFVGIGGLAVDVTNGFRYQTMMQATADASAHAAVIDLPDEIAAVATALAYAEDNMPSALYGNVLVADGVDIGVWNVAARTFTVGGPTPNAVQVTLRSTGLNDNAVEWNFLRILGIWGVAGDWDVTTEAVAMVSYEAIGGTCVENGWISVGPVHLDGPAYYEDICFHSQTGIWISSDVVFGPGVMLSAPSFDMVTGNTPLDPVPANSGPIEEGVTMEDIFTVVDYTPPLPAQVPAILGGMVDGSITPPNFITNPVVTVGSMPASPVPYTMYYVTGDVYIPAGANLYNIGIVASGELEIGPGANISNAYIGAYGEVIIDANAYIGSPDYCTSGGNGAAYIFSGDTVTIEPGNTLSGVQIVGWREIDIYAIEHGSSVTGQAGPKWLEHNEGTQTADDVVTEMVLGCTAPSLLGGVYDPSGGAGGTPTPTGYYIVN